MAGNFPYQGCLVKPGNYVTLDFDFLLIAIIAGVFGFTGIASGAAAIAEIIFYVFLVLLEPL